MLGAISLNEEIGNKRESAIGQTIGRNKPRVASVRILENASRLEAATEPAAIATPVAVRVPETPAQVAEEAEIRSGTAAFRVAEDLEVPAPLAEAVAPVEAAPAAAALADHPVWAAADRVAEDQGAAGAGGAVADSCSQC
jgi:hypothetical protein